MLDELLEALCKLKRGKASGKTGIVPELLVYCGAEAQGRLLQIMEDVWRAGTVVRKCYEYFPLIFSL